MASNLDTIRRLYREEKDKPNGKPLARLWDWAMDADGLVVRPGPRLIDGVEALAAILHPDLAGPPHPAAARIVRRPEPPQLPEVGSRASTTGGVRP